MKGEILLCSELISPKSVRERKSTDSERECPPQMAARFLHAAEQREERSFHIDFCLRIKERLIPKSEATFVWPFILFAFNRI